MIKGSSITAIFLLNILFIVVLVIIIKSYKQDGNKMIKIESSTYQNSQGWGYNILANNKIFIHQQNIPAISGVKEFNSKEDAGKIASMVIKKILKGKSPAVTLQDITSSKIIH